VKRHLRLVAAYAVSAALIGVVLYDQILRGHLFFTPAWRDGYAPLEPVWQPEWPARLPGLILAALVAGVLLWRLGRLRSGPPGRWRWRRDGIAWVLLAWFGLRWLNEFAWLAAWKPAHPVWDEGNFFLPAAVTLAQGGEYFAGLGRAAGYDPGYPLAAWPLLAPFGAERGTAAAYGLPLFWGTLALGLGVRAVWRTRGPWARLLAALTLSSLFFSHRWIEALLFRLWNGDAMAAVAWALLLIVVDDAGHGLGRKPRGQRIWLAACALAGAFAELTKPPLSSVLLPVALPLWALAIWVWSPRATARPRLVGIAAAAFGGMLAWAVWRVVLLRHGVAPFFPFAPGDWLASFDARRILDPFATYLWAEYRQMLAPFALLAGWAIVAERRFLPSLVATLGLLAAVAFVYAGPFRDQSITSAGRYCLIGMLGWELHLAWNGALGRVFGIWARRPRRRRSAA
jgi:hypothetical protein